MDFNEIQKKAFDFAADLTKQLITLATAVLAFTVTFVKDTGDPANHLQKGILIASWVCLILSTACGLLTLMALTGNLDPMAPAVKPGDPPTIKPDPNLTITSGNVIGTGRWQIYFFFIWNSTYCRQRRQHAIQQKGQR